MSLKNNKHPTKTLKIHKLAVHDKYKCFVHVFCDKKIIGYSQPAVKFPKLEIDDRVIENLNLIYETESKQLEIDQNEERFQNAFNYIKEREERKIKNKSLKTGAKLPRLIVPSELKAAIKEIDSVNKISKSKEFTIRKFIAAENKKNKLQRIENYKKKMESTKFNFKIKLAALFVPVAVQMPDLTITPFVHEQVCGIIRSVNGTEPLVGFALLFSWVFLQFIPGRAIFNLI